MARFRRSGHYRTNQHGTTFWVSAHAVDRYGWSRSSSHQWSRDLLKSLSASGSKSACFVNPNAECPVCGEQVFYYQNEYGSKVYFDELGPPWPKHPCTDNSTHSGSSSQQGTRFTAQPNARTLDELEQIDRLLRIVGESAATNYKEKMKPSWALHVVVKRIKHSGRSFMVLRCLGSDRRKLMSFARLPKACREGVIVAAKKQAISFVHPERCTVVEHEGIRISGAKEFINQISTPLNPEE